MSKKYSGDSYRRLKVVLLVCFAAVICSCISQQVVHDPPDEIAFSWLEAQTPRIQDYRDLDGKSIREKVEQFREQIAQNKRPTNETWQLHDELLEIYKRLKQTNPDGRLSVPTHTRVQMRFRSFCLNRNRASPNRGEFYFWQDHDPSIPYFHEVLDYYRTHPKISQADIQSLLWNLEQGSYYEDYPNDLRAILSAIDANASLKLPSRAKAKATGYLKDLIREAVPGAEEVEEAASQIRSSFRNYQDIADDISKLQSQHPLESSDRLETVIPEKLYADTNGDGYSAQEVAFYNPTDSPVLFNPSDYYLQPSRPDVQRLGLVPALPDEKERQSLLALLEETLFGDLLRLGVGFTPVLNDVADLYELFSGQDFVNGAALTPGERLFSALGLVAGSGAGYRYANRYLNAPEKYVRNFEEGFERVSEKELVSASSKELVLRNRMEGGEILSDATQRVTRAGMSEQNLEALASLDREWRKRGRDFDSRKRFARGMELGTLERRIVKPGEEKIFNRYHSPDKQIQGHWGTPDIFESSETAKRALALPNSNTAEALSSFRLREGAVYYTSVAAPLNHQVGGGRQIYILDLNDLLPIGRATK